MLLSPLQNKGVLVDQQWVQQRPYITQEFGKNPQIYEQFGMAGHNGLDFRAKVGTPVFAPHDGIIQVKDSGNQGYGLHVKIRNPFKECESILAHLSKATVTNYYQVNMGDVIGYTGNTGFSTGPHLHWTYKKLIPGSGEVYTWKVFERDNGYYGAIDVADLTVCFKGTYVDNNI